MKQRFVNQKIYVDVKHGPYSLSALFLSLIDQYQCDSHTLFNWRISLKNKSNLTQFGKFCLCFLFIFPKWALSRILKANATIKCYVFTLNLWNVTMLTIILVKDHYQLHKIVFKKTNYGFQILKKKFTLSRWKHSK